MNYTKGEWKVNSGNRIDADKKRVAITLYNVPAKEAKANAHLISASPDMYEALNFGLYMFDNKTLKYKQERDKFIELARKALSKAEGKGE